MFDRRLLAQLICCVWKVLSLYLTQAAPCDDAKPGAAIAVQSFGDFQNFKIIGFIENNEIIEKILRHLGLWETRSHDPPTRKDPYISELTYDDSHSQLPPIDYWQQKFLNCLPRGTPIYVPISGKTPNKHKY